MANPLKQIARFLKQATQRSDTQTADTTTLHQEFEQHPVKGLTPAKLAQILEQAEQGDLIEQADLFADIEEKDGHIMAELSKRKRAILGVDWTIQPPMNATEADTKQAQQVEALIRAIPDFEDVLLGMTDAIGYGYACLEIEWLAQDNHWQPQKISHRPARWFTVTQTDRNTLRLRNHTADGEALWQGGWIVHHHKAKSGDLARTGLLRTLAWSFLFKAYATRDLAEFLEIYGLPVRLGQYPRGATDKEKSTLLKAVTTMGHAAAGIIPEGMLIDFKEAAKGQADPFQAMIDWCEKTQSKVILGGTLTSQADGQTSTNALGNVHNEVKHDLLVADAKQIASTLTCDLIGSIGALNGWNPTRLPQFVFNTDRPDDLALYAQAIPELVSVGVPIPVSHVIDKLKIPVVKDDEAVLTNPTAPIGLSALKATPTKPEFTPDQQAIEDLADSLPKISPIQKQAIESAIRAATSPEELDARLAVVLKDADLSEFSQVMEQALFAADVMGYANVES